MVDEIYDRTYQSGRSELHAGIDDAVAKLARTVMVGFTALNRVQFDAPWKNRRNNVECG